VLPRIAPVASLGDEASIAGGGRPVSNLVRTLAESPTVYGAFRKMARVLHSETTVSDRVREIVVLRSSWLAGSEYEFGNHISIARGAGLSETQIASLAGRISAEFDAADLAVIALVEELFHKGDVADETWSAAAALFSPRALLEIVSLFNFYRGAAVLANAVRVQREDNVPGWPATPGDSTGHIGP
jgi:4-carboxymuconolactone decarboxylase